MESCACSLLPRIWGEIWNVGFNVGATDFPLKLNCNVPIESVAACEPVCVGKKITLKAVESPGFKVTGRVGRLASEKLEPERETVGMVSGAKFVAGFEIVKMNCSEEPVCVD